MSVDCLWRSKRRLTVINMWKFKHGMLKPLFKGAKRARYDICIYLHQNHYYGIRNINSFLGFVVFFEEI